MNLLKSKVGLVVGTPNPTELRRAAVLGARHYRIGTPWHFIEYQQGLYDKLEDLNALIANIALYTSEPPLASLLPFPLWIDFENVRGEEHNTDPQWWWTSTFSPEHIPALQNYVAFICTMFPHLKYLDIDCETTVPAFWQPPQTPEQYVEWVAKPVADVMKDFPDRRLVGPGLTIQKYEGNYTETTDHMRRMIAVGLLDAVDRVSVHAYGQANADKTFTQVEDFVKDTGIPKKLIWITETGFSEEFVWDSGSGLFTNLFDLLRSGENRQRNKYKTFISKLENAPWVSRSFFYQAIDKPGQGSEGLLDRKLNLKLAGTYLREKLLAT